MIDPDNLDRVPDTLEFWSKWATARRQLQLAEELERLTENDLEPFLETAQALGLHVNFSACNNPWPDVVAQYRHRAIQLLEDINSGDRSYAQEAEHTAEIQRQEKAQQDSA